MGSLVPVVAFAVAAAAAERLALFHEALELVEIAHDDQDRARGDHDAADGERHFPWLLLAHALIGFAMTWIFGQGLSGTRPTLVQGLRFGFAMALFSTVPGYLVHYAVQPLPPLLVAKQVAFGLLGMLLLGMLVAWLQPRRSVLAEPR